MNTNSNIPIRILKAGFAVWFFCISYSAIAATYTVTTTAFGTTGDGVSLRWAITQANGASGNTIAFNIAGGTKQTLTLTGNLPTITADNTTIDGTTQPGAGYPGVSPKIILAQGANTRDVLVISGNNCAVYGLYLKGGDYGINCTGDGLIVGANGKKNVISGNTGSSGIYVNKSTLTGLTIKGNYIGVDTLGTSAEANGNGGNESGIEINSSDGSLITIGGSGTGERNVISGNFKHGIYITGTTFATSYVYGNYIGTNAAGTAAIANAGDGIYTAATNVTLNIGGVNAGEGNVISGNTGNGIYIGSSTNNFATIYNNYIGANATGTDTIANRGDGILVTGMITTSSVIIGGCSAGMGNIISGNRGDGIEINNNMPTVVNATIQGNTIGTGINKTESMGNKNYGIYCVNKNLTIGGQTTSCGNYIYFNRKAGVAVDGVAPNSATGVLISHNSFSNNSLASGTGGILLTNSGNGSKAAPTITSANGTTVSGTTPVANDSIEVYLDDGGAQTEGRYFRAATKADGSGNWTATGTFNGNVTAIALDPSGNRKTSPFSTSAATGVLPIELLNFTARFNSGIVDLAWTTATETNNDYFTIERSADANSFELVSTVKGAGNSSNRLSYVSVDETPLPGISYYRLKQTDFDGKFSYSKIVSVEKNNAVTTLIFPNPTNGSPVNIRMNGVEDREVLVVLYNSLGETAYSKLLINDGGNGILTATIEPESSITPGVYYIVATSKNELFRKALVVSGQK